MRRRRRRRRKRRRRRGIFFTSSERSSVISATFLFRRRQITAHCYMPPSSAAPLSETSPRNPAGPGPLAVHWRDATDGRLSTAGCSLSLSDELQAKDTELTWKGKKADTLILEDLICYLLLVKLFQSTWWNGNQCSGTVGVNRSGPLCNHMFWTPLDVSMKHGALGCPRSPHLFLEKLCLCQGGGRREPTAVCSEQGRRGGDVEVQPTVRKLDLLYHRISERRALHTPALSWLIRVISMSDGSFSTSRGGGGGGANKPQRTTATPGRTVPGCCFLYRLCSYGHLPLPSPPPCPVSAPHCY